MVKHIRNLFRARPDYMHRTTWMCVIRNGRVSVVKRFLAEAKDPEIMQCLLRPRQLPSWLQTNWAVRKHWSVLKPIAMEGWRRSSAGAERPAWREFPCGTLSPDVTSDNKNR